jgi:hypothetical protein
LDQRLEQGWMMVKDTAGKVALICCQLGLFAQAMK